MKHGQDIFIIVYVIFIHSYFHVFLTSFPLIIIDRIYFTNIYQVPIMSKAFYWALLMFKDSFCLQRLSGRHIYVQLRYKMIRDKSYKFICRDHSSGYCDHKIIHE